MLECHLCMLVLCGHVIRMFCTVFGWCMRVLRVCELETPGALLYFWWWCRCSRFVYIVGEECDGVVEKTFVFCVDCDFDCACGNALVGVCACACEPVCAVYWDVML